MLTVRGLLDRLKGWLFGGASLSVYCFEAGKADAFLLTTRRGAVLIDAGLRGFGREIVKHLESEGIQALDYLIITHFDHDHVGGAARVINRFPVRRVLQGGEPGNGVQRYFKALDRNDLVPVTVRRTLRFRLDGVRFTVEPPKGRRYRSNARNNASLIVSAVAGKRAFLFAGDAQTERLAEYLNAHRRHYDFLKVPHHGRAEPLMAALAARIAPELAVITSSEDQPELKQTVRALKAAGARVLLTRKGPITVTTDGRTLKVRQYAERD